MVKPEGQAQHAMKLRDIFAPHEALRRDALLKSGRGLIHYTSAAAAVSIIRNRRIWMRNVRCMNDTMEVEHGFQLMQRSFSQPITSEAEKGLRAVAFTLDRIFPGVSQDAVMWFDNSLYNLRHKTYVTCLSEHGVAEDSIGRLSMWRSYTASQVGVGIVINPRPLYLFAESFGAFSASVNYFDDEQLGDLFTKVAANIDSNGEYLLSRGRNEVVGFLCLLLRLIAMCSKHPGFHEEKEWRVMHTEGLDSRGALERDVECIAGIPQPIYKIPLQDHPDSGIVGIAIPDLINHVLIGPTQFPVQVRDALIIELEKAGLPDAQSKVSCSDIPLRT